MKRSLSLLCLAFIASLCFAQTPEQLKQLKNLTPQQIEALKKAQESSGSVGTGTGTGKDNDKNNPKIEKNIGKRERTYIDPEKEAKKVAEEKKQEDELKKERGELPFKSYKKESREEQLKKLPHFDKNGIIIAQAQDSVVLSLQQYEILLAEPKIEVFGREIFRADNLTFAPSLAIATPTNYIISSGDQLLIDMWGAAEATYELTVSPEGNINIPNVGLINVSGLTMAAAEQRIKTKLATTVAGLSDGTVNVKVTLGDIRSIKVNIIGEALVPGTYTLPSLATLFNALYAAGGVSEIGSLRNIKLYRAGKEIATLDVYDYLLGGKQDVNVRLEDNDQILVMPYENIVTVAGKVRRPKLYELKKGETVDMLINSAGGFTGDAYTENVSVARRSGGRQFSVHTVARPDFGEFIMMDRDSVTIGEILKTYANRVSIEGAVWRPGDYELSDKIKTVGDLLQAAEGLADDAFAGRAQVVRTKPDKTLQIISFNAGKILMGQAEDIPLIKEDQIIVTSVNDLREDRTVTIKGEVNEPHIMPYAENMTLEDIIILSRGLKESASLAQIEVARRIKNPHSKDAATKKADIFTFTIPSDLSLASDVAGFALEPYDEVFIRRSPGYSEQISVTVEGEVLFSGDYALSSSADRLSDLIAKTGGVTPEAYIKGAYLRRVVTKYDMERIESIAKLMERNNKKKDSVIVDLVKEGDYFPVGIDLLIALNNPSSDANLTLRKGDILVVPTFNNTVKISGAVNYPNTTTFTPEARMDHYIDRAGGYAQMAKRKPFVIYMNGTVAATMNGRRPKIEPGCEIVIPQKPERTPMSPQGWISLGSSVVSMAAMIVSLLK